MWEKLYSYNTDMFVVFKLCVMVVELMASKVQRKQVLLKQQLQTYPGSLFHTV